MCSAAAGPRAGGSSPSATSGRSATPSSRASSAATRFDFPKSSRLLKRGEFRRVYDHGSRLTSASFALFWAPRPEPAQGPRAGFTTPRALGNAVVRNRLRRRLREALRLELPKFSDRNVDIVFHPRRPVLAVGFDRLRVEVEKVLRKCRTS